MLQKRSKRMVVAFVLALLLVFAIASSAMAWVGKGSRSFVATTSQSSTSTISLTNNVGARIKSTTTTNGGDNKMRQKIQNYAWSSAKAATLQGWYHTYSNVNSATYYGVVKKELSDGFILKAGFMYFEQP